MRLPIVGILGSGTERHETLAGPLGNWLATQPVHLLTGGGQGVMAEVSRAFAEVTPRQGSVIGILPAGSDGIGSRSGYPNQWVEIPIITHLPLSGAEGASPMSRNHINILSCSCLVALPGSAGTQSEIALALRYRRPIILFGPMPGTWQTEFSELAITAELEPVKQFVLRHARL